MKCKYCGKEIDKCYVGNPDCEVKEHHMCKEHIDRIGMGLKDPCRYVHVEVERDWYKDHMK